jgi:hypothetical protein
MEDFIRISKIFIIFSPVFLWVLFIWHVGKWDKKHKSKTEEEREKMNYYKKKNLFNFLLWLSSFVAIILLLILWAKVGLKKL